MQFKTLNTIMVSKTREKEDITTERRSLARKVSLHETFGSKKAFLGTQVASEKRGNYSIFKQSAAFFHNFSQFWKIGQIIC